MSDEIRDPGLEGIRDAWEPPPPTPRFHERVRTAYEQEFRRPRAWRWILAPPARLVTAASAIGLAAFLGSFGVSKVASRIRDLSGRGNSVEVVRIISPAPPSASSVQGNSVEQPASNPIARRLERPLSTIRAGRRAARPAEEVVTKFFPLMDAPMPLGRGAVLRVVVSAAAMRSVGLRVREDALDGKVQADVLIGEEGLPRAIRFVGVNQ